MPPKYHAIKFRLQVQGIPETGAVFDCESGDGLDTLTRGLQIILVKNAAEDMRKKASEISSQNQITDHQFLARSNFLGVNRSYTLAFSKVWSIFSPKTEQWAREAIR